MSERAVPAVEFDHHSREYAVSSMDIHRRLRQECPVAHADAHGGYWVVSRYEDVATVARDDVTFSSAWNDGTGGVIIPPAPTPHVPIEMDPPEFHAYRRLLNPIFSPAAAERWRPAIERWTATCIDAVIESGRIDLVLDLANPVPALFTCEFLGLPVEDWERYAGPYHRAVYTPPDDESRVSALVDEMQWIVESLHELVAKRRREPVDDVISTLVQAQIDGQPLTDERVVNICDLIMAGGFDTTTAATTSALMHLHRNRDDRRRLIDEPALLPTAVEEFLRYFSPTQALARTVVSETTVAGQVLEPGERVLISWASANHDDAVFDRPDEIIIDRQPNRHAAFGIGAHRCLGSHVARLEIATMIREVLGRIPDYAVDETTAEPYTSIGVVNGWITMPARFTPGPRRGAGRLPGKERSAQESEKSVRYSI